MIKVAIAGIPKETVNYVAALEAAGMQPVVTLDAAAASQCASLLIPGGGDIAPELFGEENHGSREIDREFDDKQLKIMDIFVCSGRPVLGICRGHQVINVYFGGGIIQDLPSAASHRAAPGADALHASVSAPGSLLRQFYGERFVTNSAHHQGLGKIGKGLSVISTCLSDGVVEAISHESRPILGLQWHPERMAYGKRRADTVDGAKIFEYFKILSAD